ncbi:MAG: LysE/ArgO family amino acid transporter [Legionellaceae bacterium]|nr:LysE/ArgO family amino acid transporter [Legionellaceae bacterium]
MVYAFLYGVVLAFGLILPLGVQNVFVFNQGANQEHFLHALPCVITASICDSILIICAVLSVSVLVLQIAWLKVIFLIVGFCFLLYMGLVSWYSVPNKLQPGSIPLSAKRQILFTISVSLLNPHALLDTVGVIGSNSLQYAGSEKFVFTLACILVSCCWFFSLSIVGHFFHRLDTTGIWQQRMNKISACIIWAVALFIGWQLVVAL